MNQQSLSAFIWSVADLLRGDYKQSEYGKVILPFTVLRRLDCVLESTKEAVLAEKLIRETAGLNPEPFLLRKSGQLFYNTSPLDLKKLMGDQDHIGENLRAYMQAFSPAVRDIFESFEFHTQIDKLAKSGLLYVVTEKFANIDLHPNVVSNEQMGAVFEELIRKFAELSNETAGEHFTPRDAIRLMVNLIFIEDDAALTKPGIVRTLYDPTAGTGGMLSVADEHLTSLNPGARLRMFGQELNPESYAICKADMLIKGQDIANIIFGNTLSADGLIGKVFDYMLSNPPFGVEWKKIEAVIRKEFEQMGFNGRFGPGLPRVSDGSLLFLLHLINKMRPAVDGGSRFGLVLNGSPLFTGGAGSGESEIRRYVLENDLVEAIIALPTDMFYNTGISTYIWIVSNRKPASRKGKLQLIDASSFWQKMRKASAASGRNSAPNTSKTSPACSAVSKNPLARLTAAAYRSAASLRTRTSATAPSPSSVPSAMSTARSCLAARAKARANRWPMPHCATQKTCRSVKTSKPTSNAKCCRTPRTHGSITRKPKSATRSRSTVTSTCSNHRVRWRRLMQS